MLWFAQLMSFIDVQVTVSNLVHIWLNKIGKLSCGQISWHQNSTFSGDQIFNHEVEFMRSNFFHFLWGQNS